MLQLPRKHRRAAASACSTTAAAPVYLAIAAAKLGAAHVDAVDIDPQAVETTRANARANGVELNAVLPDALGRGGTTMSWCPTSSPSR